MFLRVTHSKNQIIVLANNLVTEGILPILMWPIS